MTKSVSLYSDRCITTGVEEPQKIGWAKGIDNEEQIAALTEINGVSLRTIELRMQVQSEEERYFDSYDALRESLVKSWELARKQRIKHVKIAEFLQGLVPSDQSTYHGQLIRITVCLQRLFPYLYCYPPQHLDLTIMKEVKDVDIFDPIESKEVLNDGFKLYNSQSKTSVIWTPMRGAFISGYGFYPRQIGFLPLVSVLTGFSVEELQD